MSFAASHQPALMRESASTLDLVYSRAQDCLQTCPKDEARTREYIHRTRMQCELVIERRKARSLRLLGQENTQKTKNEFPAISMSAPASPVGWKGKRPNSRHSSRNVREELSNGSTVSRDRRSLSAMAKLHGEIATEYKVPPDVTWSTNMATKPKEWCEFVLDKPNRVWNWEQRLSKIEKSCENGEVAVPVRQKTSAVLQDECEILQKISTSLLVTRKDEEINESKRQLAALCEQTLEAQFELACNSKRIGAGGVFNQQNDKAKRTTMDGRDFGLYLNGLGIVPNLLSKTELQRQFYAAKSSVKDSNELEFSEFKAAMKSIAKVVGKPLAHLVGVQLPHDLSKQGSDTVTKAVDAERDAHILSERKLIGKILESMTALPGHVSILPHTKKASQSLSPDLETLSEESEDEKSEVDLDKGLKEFMSGPMEAEADILSKIRSDLDALSKSEACSESLLSNQSAFKVKDPVKQAIENIDKALVSSQLAIDIKAGASETRFTMNDSSSTILSNSIHEQEQNLLRQVEMAALGPGLSPEAFDLLEEFFNTNSSAHTAKDIGRMFRQAQVSAQELKRRVLQALDSGHHIQTFFAILRSLHRRCLDDEEVGALLKKFIHDLKDTIPVPSRNADWVSKGASVVSLTSPSKVLIGEEITICFDYHNRHAIAANSWAEPNQYVGTIGVRTNRLPAGVLHPSQADWKPLAEAYGNQMLKKKKEEMKDTWRFRMIAARPLFRHSSKDYIAVCKFRLQPEVNHLSEYDKVFNVRKNRRHLTAFELAAKHVSREIEHQYSHDLVVATIQVPPGNTGLVTIPKGLDVPGKYFIKYFAEGSVLPLSVSEVFEVSFPMIGIQVMKEIEMGRPLQILLMLVNGGDADRVSTSDTDWIGIFFNDELQRCIWRQEVPSWCGKSTILGRDILFGQPGDYTIRYHLGLHHDYIAGSETFRANFPRRSANFFDNLNIDDCSLEESREVRIFLSLDMEDMDKEQTLLMTEGTSELQKAMDDYLVTVFFVCLNWRIAPEHTSSCSPRSLIRLFEEVDRCRPFFVGVLGDRYGNVPHISDTELNNDHKELVERSPWFSGMKNPHIQSGICQSMTELEFAYAFLYGPCQPSHHTLIYFRDSAFALSLLDTPDRMKYFPQKRGDVSLKRCKLALNDLKMRTKVKPGTKTSQYLMPKEGVNRIVQDILKLLKEKFPGHLVPNNVQKAYQFSTFLMRSHMRIFDKNLFSNRVAQAQHLMKADNNLILIVGESGSGKTSFAFQVPYDLSSPVTDEFPNSLTECWQLLESHLSSSSMEMGGSMFAAFCSDGPRKTLQKHLFIATFIHQNLQDRSLAGILLLFYSQLKKKLLLKLPLPTAAECEQQVDTWLKAANEYGLIWLIDGLEHVQCNDFSWFIKSLRTAQSGLLIMLTCTPRSYIRSAVEVANLSNVIEFTMEALSANAAWDIQTIYFQSYKLNEDEVDESAVSKLCNHSSTPLFLRVSLLGYRLLGSDAATLVVQFSDATEAFLEIVRSLKKAMPFLFETLVLLSFTNCGLRESEILELVGCSALYLREMRDLVLDEFMVSLFRCIEVPIRLLISILSKISSYGIMDYKDISLKQALREYYIGSRDDESAPALLFRALQFFSMRASNFRRACEGPHLAFNRSIASSEADKNLFVLISSSSIASRLIETGQADLVLAYLKVMKTESSDFCTTIISDFRKRLDHKRLSHSYLSGDEAEIDVFQSLVDMFQAFGDGNSIDLKSFLCMMDYLNLEDTDRGISYFEISETFDAVAALTLQRRKGHLDYNGFKATILEICKAMKITCAEFVKDADARIKLKRIFEQFAMVRDVSNTRTQTIDSNEFFSILEYCDVLNKMQKSDALHLFKTFAGHSIFDDPLIASTNEPVVSSRSEPILLGTREPILLMKFQNFVNCMGELSKFLTLDLQTILTPHKNVAPTTKQQLYLLGMQDESEDLQNCSKEFVDIFSHDVIQLANLFCHLKQDIHALRILYLMLVAVFGLESFSELSQAELVVGNVQDVVAAVALVSDCTIRMARSIHARQEALSTRLKRLQDETADLEIIVQEGQKRPVKRRNTAVRDTVQDALERNINRLDQSRAEVTNTCIDAGFQDREMDELRRRAAVCFKAAQRLIIKAKLSGEDRTTLIASMKKFKGEFLKCDLGHWTAPKISWSVTFKLLRCLKAARQRIEVRKIAEEEAAKKVRNAEGASLFEKYAASTIKLESGEVLNPHLTWDFDLKYML